MTMVVDLINHIIWGYVLIYGLIGAGLFYTLRLGWPQIRHFPDMLRYSLMRKGSDVNGISPFQALCTSLASRVGMGNIAGVAVALVLGGPGAIFWMWVVAFVGMATAYAESTLAQLYKVKDKTIYRGGPAHYIARGLGLPWLAALFSACLILSIGLIVNALQSNAIADAMELAFGLPKLGTGVLLAGLTALVIFGGIRKIASVAEYVVPFMAGAYLLVALTVMALNITEVPAVLGQIFTNAFGFGEAMGGIAGGMTAALLNGVKRGLFSNEAGMGSAPHIAAAATPTPHHPASQGFVQAFAVFIDTIVVCTCTAVFILLSGVYVPGGDLTGTQLTQLALADHFGAFGPIFIALAIFFFAFTTIIGCYAYAEMALAYLGWAGRSGRVILRLLVLVMVVWGALQTVQTVFNLADAALGIMAVINLGAILALSGQVAVVTRDFARQRRETDAPRFKIEDHPHLPASIDRDIWR